MEAATSSPAFPSALLSGRQAGFTMKQFHIAQSHCAMKVSSDACLFGALIDAPNAKRALDLGTGTGLLSLMLAQRWPGQIDAIDLDADAALQAKENFTNSPFSGRIQTFNIDLQNFKPDCSYGLIFCNPPFFEGTPPSQKMTSRHLARHESAMPITEFIGFVERHLEDQGTLWLLVAAHRSDFYERRLGSINVQVVSRFRMKDHADAKPHRIILRAQKSLTSLALSSDMELPIFVDAAHHSLSDIAKNLLSAYYLRY